MGRSAEALARRKGKAKPSVSGRATEESNAGPAESKNTGQKRLPAHATCEPVSSRDDDDSDHDEVRGSNSDSEQDSDGSAHDGLPMMADENAEDELEVEFGFFDPRTEDYHGVKSLLSCSQNVLPESTDWDVVGCPI